MTNQLASLEQRDYFYLDPFSSVNLVTYIIISLTKWMSNDRKVLASISPSQRAKSVVNLDFGEIPTEHALAVQWRVVTDKFGFKGIAKERPSTRRGILSVASSVYDPLGFLAPFTLSAKLILQELCRKKIAGMKR